jgi:hypothetical protein
MERTIIANCQRIGGKRLHPHFAANAMRGADLGKENGGLERRQPETPFDSSVVRGSIVVPSGVSMPIKP